MAKPCLAQIKRGHMAGFKDALVADGKAVKTRTNTPLP
jgi:hypothetical protein